MPLWRVVCVLLSVLVLLPVPPAVVAQQQRMDPLGSAADAAVNRYRDQRLSSAYYDPSDQVPQLRYGPMEPQSPAHVPKRDVHAGVKGYGVRRCEDCHADSFTKSHTLKGNTTCRQCHSEEPIASVDHYFSPMNPIRRHAYVCAKCHEGSSASFATYVVHEPRQIATVVRESFPAMYWAHAFMLALIVTVMAIFLVHGVLWWFREWFVKRNKSET